MEIKKPAVAGTLESSDCQIVIRPNGGEGIEIELESDVAVMFGDSIRTSTWAGPIMLNYVEIRDKGALDCVIKARMECVICRGAEEKYDWTKEDAR